MLMVVSLFQFALIEANLYYSLTHMGWTGHLCLFLCLTTMLKLDLMLALSVDRCSVFQQDLVEGAAGKEAFSCPIGRSSQLTVL